jgi:hypothetical protein
MGIRRADPSSGDSCKQLKRAADRRIGAVGRFRMASSDIRRAMGVAISPAEPLLLFGGHAMPDDQSDRGPQDRTRINLHEDHEIRHWTQVMGCTADELRAAVEAVGVSVDAVRRHLEDASFGGQPARRS